MEHLIRNTCTISHAIARPNPVSVTYTAPSSSYMWQRTVSMQTNKEYASEKRLKHVCVCVCVCVCVWTTGAASPPRPLWWIQTRSPKQRIWTHIRRGWEPENDPVKSYKVNQKVSKKTEIWRLRNFQIKAGYSDCIPFKSRFILDNNSMQ